MTGPREIKEQEAKCKMTKQNLKMNSRAVSINLHWRQEEGSEVFLHFNL